MKSKGSRLGLSIGLLFWAACMVVPSTTLANLKTQKKAKELGFPATNCLYCHNERGKWLIAEKEKRGVKEVDPAWLKDYPGEK